MANYFYCIWKRGDNNVYRHGMLVHIYDPDEWGHDLKQELAHFSSWMHTVYLITKHDKTEKAKYIDGLKPFGPVDEYNIPDTTSKDFRKSKLMLDVDKLKVASNDTSIGDKLISGEVLEKIDCTVLKDISKSTEIITGTIPIDDKNVITSGSYTHGTAGDYSDIITLWADIGTPNGNFTFTQISDQSISVALSVSGITWGSYTYDFVSGTPHGGALTGGWKITSSYNLNQIYIFTTGGTPTVKFSGITFVSASNSNITIYIDQRGTTGALTSIHDCFIDGAGYTSTGAGIYVRTNNGGNVEFYNTSIRDFSGIGFDYFGTTGGGALKLQQMLIEGCTTGLDLSNLSTASLINVGVVNNTTDITGHANATANFVITGDATGANGNWGTGANCITGVTEANEWELDDTSSDYAAVLATAPNADTSTTSPTLSANLMDGAWTNEIGPKIKISAPVVGGPPLGSLSMMGVGR